MAIGAQISVKDWYKGLKEAKRPLSEEWLQETRRPFVIEDLLKAVENPQSLPNLQPLQRDTLVSLQRQLHEAHASIEYQRKQIEELQRQLSALGTENTLLRRGIKNFGHGYVAMHDALKKRAP